MRRIMVLLAVAAISLFALTPVASAANGSGGSFHYSFLGANFNGGGGGSSTGSGGGEGCSGTFLGIFPQHGGFGSGGSTNGSGGGGGGTCL